MKRMLKISEKGQSLVEFALIMPVLFLFFTMLLDASRVVFYYSTIYNAAREGARYGIALPDPCYSTPGVKARASRMSLGLLSADDVVSELLNDDRSVYNCSTSTVYPALLKVGVSYSFSGATPILRILRGNNTINLSAESTMRIE